MRIMRLSTTWYKAGSSRPFAGLGCCGNKASCWPLENKWQGCCQTCPETTPVPKQIVCCRARASSNHGKLCIPRRPFANIVREVLLEAGIHVRFQQEALDVLQEATEAWFVGLLEDSYHITTIARRVTLQSPEFEHACRQNKDTSLYKAAGVRKGRGPAELRKRKKETCAEEA